MRYADRLRHNGKAPIIKRGEHYDLDVLRPELSEYLPDSLDELERQIDKLKERIWESAWFIGKRLIAINERYLIKTGYDTISEYAEARFGLKQRTTYNYMFMAKEFDRLQALAMGSKLFLLERVDKEKREEYIQWLQQENPKYREIEERIKQDKSASQYNPKQAIVFGKRRVSFDANYYGLDRIDKNKKRDFEYALDQAIRAVVKRFCS